MTGSTFNRVPRAGLALTLAVIALSLGVGGCSLIKKKTVSCPAVAVVSGTGTLTHFKAGSELNTDDVRYQAEISGLSLTCRKARGGVEATVTFEISARSGPADTSGSATIPFFVAVTLVNEQVLSKRVFSNEHHFPVQTGNSTFREEVVEFIPLTEGREARDFEILIGFQLTPDQLEYNLMH
ncbi:MAG: hypothetical protein ACE5EM_08485 [Sphingomonadales bacterium]